MYQEPSHRFLVSLKGELYTRISILAKTQNLSISDAIHLSLLHSPIGEGIEMNFGLQHYIMHKIFIDEMETLTAQDVYEILVRRGFKYRLSSVRTELSKLAKKGKLRADRLFDRGNGRTHVYCLNALKYPSNR